jgi:hypothetical protein
MDPRHPTNPNLRAPWRKGVSGNPAGRPPARPELREIRELAAQYGPEAIQRLVQLMRKSPAPVQLAAAQALLDRAYGKPVQALEHTGPDGERLLPSPAELMQLSDGQLARLGDVVGAIRREISDNGDTPAS